MGILIPVPRPENSANRPNHTGELALIERIRLRTTKNRARASVKLGIGDDCAILKPPTGEELLVTTDFTLEGRHFRQDWHSPESAGHRTLARGLSDLASMGAKPLAAFLSLALPRRMARDTAWLDSFLDGLLTLAGQHDVPLAGGDTSESPSDHILADIVLLGTAPAGTALRRSGARQGDILYCTGALGGATVELSQLSMKKNRKARSHPSHPHLFPVPRLSVGRYLRSHNLASACIDLSDGLSTDLDHLCEASNVSAEVDGDALPLHALTAGLRREDAFAAALHGGEDYELLFAAPADKKIPRSVAGVPIARIGRVTARNRKTPPMVLIDRQGLRTPLRAAGWEHLR